MRGVFPGEPSVEPEEMIPPGDGFRPALASCRSVGSALEGHPSSLELPLAVSGGAASSPIASPSPQTCRHALLTAVQFVVKKPISCQNDLGRVSVAGQPCKLVLAGTSGRSQQGPPPAH